MRKFGLTVSLIALTASAAFAQETPEITQNDDNEDVDVIIVQGFNRDYLANKGQTSAVGLDLTQLETPAAISVISQDLLKDQQVNNVDDALRNVAGVTKFKTGNGGEERFSIRGFDSSQSIYKDGARINNRSNGSNIPSTETANIQRIEVLKGPSALLYGQGQPGGVINYITKRPQAEYYNSLEIIGGSFDFYKVEADMTGAVPGANDQLSYRLVGAYEDSGSFRDEVERQRLLINPSIAWSPIANFNLILGYEYIDDDYTQDRGQVLDGNSVDGYTYSNRLNEELFFGIPNWSTKSAAESQRFYAIAEYDITDFWRTEAVYSYTDNDKDVFDSTARFSTGNLDVIAPIGSSNENEVSIEPRLTFGTGEARQITLKNFFDFEDGFGFEHQILASYTFEELTSVSTTSRADRRVTFNVATREYSTTFDPSEIGSTNGFVQLTDTVGFGLRTTPPTTTESDTQEQGFNFIDYVTLNDQFAVLIGGRYSDFEDNEQNYSESNFSFRGGLVYSPADNISFYASYSEGYLPAAGLEGIDGGPIDPETSVSYELGAKFTLNDERLLITAAIYDVTREGVPFAIDPTAADIRFGNIGEISNQGFELEVVGQITDAWRVQGGYAYIDAEITESGEGEFGAVFTEGNKLGGIAENNFNLFTFYEFEVADGDLGVGGGVFAQGDVFASTANEAEFDGWVQVDLAAYYKRGPWKAQLNASNVFEEEYQQAQSGASSDAFAALRVGTSTPRTIIGSIAVEF